MNFCITLKSRQSNDPKDGQRQIRYLRQDDIDETLTQLPPFERRKVEAAIQKLYSEHQFASLIFDPKGLLERSGTRHGYKITFLLSAEDFRVTSFSVCPHDPSDDDSDGKFIYVKDGRASVFHLSAKAMGGLTCNLHRVPHIAVELRLRHGPDSYQESFAPVLEAVMVEQLYNRDVAAARAADLVHTARHTTGLSGQHVPRRLLVLNRITSALRSIATRVPRSVIAERLYSRDVAADLHTIGRGFEPYQRAPRRLSVFGWVALVLHGVAARPLPGPVMAMWLYNRDVAAARAAGLVHTACHTTGLSGQRAPRGIAARGPRSVLAERLYSKDVAAGLHTARHTTGLSGQRASRRLSALGRIASALRSIAAQGPRSVMAEQLYSKDAAEISAMDLWVLEQRASMKKSRKAAGITVSVAEVSDLQGVKDARDGFEQSNELFGCYPSMATLLSKKMNNLEKGIIFERGGEVGYQSQTRGTNRDEIRSTSNQRRKYQLEYAGLVSTKRRHSSFDLTDESCDLESFMFNQEDWIKNHSGSSGESNASSQLQ